MAVSFKEFAGEDVGVSFKEFQEPTSGLDFTEVQPQQPLSFQEFGTQPIIGEKEELIKKEIEPLRKPIFGDILQKEEEDPFPLKAIKFLGRVVIEPFQPIVNDLREWNVVSKIYSKVVNGELPPEIFDEIKVTQKTPLQIVGDVSQSVLAVTPFRAIRAIKGLPLFKKAITSGVFGSKIGGAFGVAVTLSDDPDIKASNLLLNTSIGTAGGFVIGAGTSLTGIGIKGLFDITKGKITGKFSTNLEPNLIERMFPSLYEKRVNKVFKGTKNLKVEEAPKLGTVQKLLEPITPQRALLNKDPKANFVWKEAGNAFLEHKNAYINLFDDNWNKIKSLKDKEALELFGLMDKRAQQVVAGKEAGKGVKIPEHLKEPFEALVQLEAKGFGIAKQLGIDVSKWRFNVNNHITRMFRGSHVLLEEVVGFPKPTFKKLSFVENRAEGLKQILKLASENPKGKYSLVPRTKIYPKPTSVPLSRRGWFKLQSKIAEKLKMSPTEAMEEALMQGVAFIKRPKRTLIGQFLFRKGTTSGYLKDPRKIYPAIWWKMTKAIHLDPKLKKLQFIVDKIEDFKIKQIAQDLINTVGGEYKEQLLGYDATKFITGAQAQLKIGGRLSTPIVNLFQRLYGIATAGFKNFVKANKMIFTKEGQEILKKIGVSVEAPLYETLGQQAPKKVLNPLFFFGKTESGTYVGNRNIVALANYLKGKELNLNKLNKNLKKLGLPNWSSQEELAIDHARQAVSATQFRYDISGFPKLMRNNMGKLLLQFKTYPLNQIANMINVVQLKPLPGLELFYPKGLTKSEGIKQAIIFFGTMFSQGGLRALSFGVERLLPIAVLVKLATDYPEVLYGVSAWLGVDVSRSATVEVENLNPLDYKSFIPLSDLNRIWKAITEGNPKELLAISPAIYRIYRGFDALENDKFLRNIQTNENVIKISTPEIVAYMLGLNPLKVSQEADIHFANVRLEREAREKSSKGKLQIVNAIKEGDIEKAKEIYEDLLKQGVVVKPQEIAESFKRGEVPRLTRDILDSGLIRRPEVIQRFQEFTK